MKNLYKNDEIDVKIQEIKKKSIEILNEGLIGKGNLSLQQTLESHQNIKSLLDELDYVMQSDIPIDLLEAKISSIQKEIERIYKNYKNSKR